MVLEEIFLTGGSGTLGTELIEKEQEYDIKFSAPSSQVCDIQCYNSVFNSLKKSSCHKVLHCAALTSVIEIESDALQACLINTVGTFNIIKACKLLDKKLIFISTDYVFDGKKGNYKIDDPINPISKYAKAAAELLVRTSDNSLVLRTSFFGKTFPYDKALVDQYSTKDYVDIIAPLILEEIKKDRCGIVHIGTQRSSTYEKAKRRKSDIKKMFLRDISFGIPKDVSLYLGV